MDTEIILFLVCMGFIASFIDSVVGGGGLISIPALMMTPLSPLMVLGTNKLAAFMGAFTSFLTFLLSGKINFKKLFPFFSLGFLGSLVGVITVRQIPSDFLKPLVVTLLVLILIYTLKDKNFDKHKTAKKENKKILLAFCATLFGFYDGFFGPGTGSFLLFLFLYLGYDFLEAAGNARTLNFADNMAATLLFMYFDLVNYTYAICMGISMILGAYCGAKMALVKGTGYIRPLFITVTSLLIAKQIFDLFHF